jgi:hypothetical protein
VVSTSFAILVHGLATSSGFIRRANWVTWSTMLSGLTEPSRLAWFSTT